MISTPNAPRIAVLIAYADCSPFREIVEATHKFLWSAERTNGIDVYYISGRPGGALKWKVNERLEKIRWSKLSPALVLWDRLFFFRFKVRLPKVKEIGDLLEVQVPTGLRYLGISVLAGFKHLTDNGYTHIYKTTASSVVNLDLLKNAVANDSCKEMLYAGPTVLAPHEFVSGASLLVNHKTVQFLYQQRSSWKHHLLDDCAIGRILEGNATIVPMQTQNLGSIDDLNKLSDYELSRCFHFRCKSTRRPEGDIQILTELMKRIDLR